MRSLTEEEQAVVLSHYTDDEGNAGGGLVGWFISKYNLDYDEWHGLVCQYLIRAVQTHDASKGKLSTHFHTVAKNRMINELSKQREFTGFDDSIENELTFVNEDFQTIHYTELIDSLDSRSRQISYLLIKGFTQYEIAEELGLTTRTIRTEVAKLRGTLEEMMR